MDLDIKYNPPEDDSKVVERIVEIEKPVDRIVEKEKIVEKPVVHFVDREKIVTVPEVHTEALYGQLANLNARTEELKQLLKDFEGLIKVSFQDNSKFIKMENSFNSKVESLGYTIELLKPEIFKSADSLRKILVDISEKLSKPVQSPKDYQPILEGINKAIHIWYSEINADTKKIKDITSYLPTIKAAIDSINVNPKVNVTTQVIEDKNTIEALKKQSEEFSKFTTDQKSKLLEILPKLDSVKATVEGKLTSMDRLVESILVTITNLKESLLQGIVEEVKKSGISEQVKKDLEQTYFQFSINLANGLEDFKNQITGGHKYFMEEVLDKFDQHIQSNTFNLSIILQREIPELVRKELNQYFSTIKLDVSLPPQEPKEDNSEQTLLSLLDLVKTTIKETLESKEPIQFIVDTVDKLPIGNTNYIGRIIIVRYVSLFKRNKPFIYNGEIWSQI